MRTGANFARGSCRALKWMALFGVVFAMGAGQAVAQKPSKPVLTAVEGVTATSVKLTWTVPGGGPAIASFVTQTSTTGGADFAAADPGDPVTGSGPTTRETTVTAVADTRTTYRVGAVNPAGTTWSNVRHFTTENAPPAPVFPTTALTIGDGQVTLTWTQPAAVSGTSGAPDYYEYNYKPGTDADTFADTGADARRWTRVGGGSGARRQVVSGLTNGTSYVFGVRAVNRGGPTPADPLVAAVPSGKPGAPTDLTVTLGTPSSGKVDVTLAWMEPESTGGSAIVYYEYEIDGFRAWTATPDSSTFIDITSLDADMAAGYTYRVRAVNANGAGPAVGSDGTTGGPGGPTTPRSTGGRGQITAMTFSGGTEGPRTIGGVERYHVGEGDTSVMLNVTVQWDHDELAELAALGQRTVSVDVMIKGAQPNEQTHVLPRWLSWIDDEGDVDFPNTPGELGRLSGRVMVPVPPAPTEFPNSTRHHQNRTGSIALLILHDEHEAEEDAFYIDAVDSADVDLDATDARNRTTPLAVIEDDEKQKVIISGASRMHEGDGSETFTVRLDPNRLDLPLEVRLDVVDLGGQTISGTLYSLNDASLVFNEGGNGVNSDTVELRFPSPDGDRVNNDYQLQATVVDYSLTSGGFDPTVEGAHPIEIVDIHNLPPVTVAAYSPMQMEGDTVELTLVVNRNPRETPRVDPETNIYTNEALTIMVGTGGDATKGDDYTVPTSVSVDKYEGGSDWTQSVKVAVELAIDEDVEVDDETLDLTFTVNGTDTENGPIAPRQDQVEHWHDPGTASLTISDETEKLVSVKDEAYGNIQGVLGTPPTLTTGMSAELMGSNLFDYDSAAVSVAYATSVEGGAATAAASGGTVTIRGASPGEAKVTITATATPRSSSLVTNQTKSNVAELTFPVMVEDEVLIFTVKGPDDMNLAEGMSAMVTVTTNRPVRVNTEVMLMRDGSSSADDMDYELDPPLATIMAGEKMGSTMVMAVEDNMAEDMEMLTLFLVVDGMQMTDKSVSLYLWDDAVPALPIIAQLLLGGLLAVGGFRRYRRRS